jgi:hypothetical protein
MTFTMPRLRRAPEPAPGPETPQAARADSDPASVTAVQPAAPAPVEAAQMSTLLHCRLLLAHHFRVARRKIKDTAERDGGWVNGLLAAKPPSVNEQCEYVRTRGWLPPGHEGGIADVAGVGYHRAIGYEGVGFGNAVSGLAARPFRFAAGFGVFLVTLAALLFITASVVEHQALGAAATGALTVTGALAAVVIGWWLAVTLSIAGYRAARASGTKEN